MGEGTKVISLADAMARIEVLEAKVDALQVMAAEAFAELLILETRLPSATQVAEAA